MGRRFSPARVDGDGSVPARARKRAKQHVRSAQRDALAMPVLAMPVLALPVVLALGSAFVTASTLPVFAVEATPAVQPASSDAQKQDPKKKDKMFVEATELVYNDKTNTVTAEGNAQVYYQGRTLEADRVIYDRNTKRVYAEGHAKMIEKDGTVLVGDRFDLTDDFKDGFIESLRSVTTDKTYLSAPHTERVQEDTTVFDKGTYTACDACKNDPTKPALWRVQAKRIIHKNEEHMIYYEDAWLEFFNVPIAYVPYLSSPDPTVHRKSGLLLPNSFQSTYLGFGYTQPIFWDLADNYDITFTPTYLSRQGFFGRAEWRHRLEDGSYFIKAAGINQEHPEVFGDEPFGSADHKFRGSIESKGEFNLTDKWKFGWAGMLMTDKRFISDYWVPSSEYSSNFISELTSTIYLTGQGDRSYFDLRGYYFEGLSTHDLQVQQSNARPVLDYNRTFDLDPAKTYGIGGQLTLDFNLTSLSAEAASYQSVGVQRLDSYYNNYNVCATYTPGTTNNSCLLRGLGGDYTRATVETSWQRKYIDPIGEVWTPFAFARANGQFLSLNTTNSYAFGGSTYGVSNAYQSNFVGGSNEQAYGNVNPGVGLEYRYPFLAKTPIGSLVFEPIAQIIVRPNSQLGSTSTVNLDAQSLVFDDTNLFQWNKYSGYDRFETGTRANYGAQATMNFDRGGYANVLFGQSYQVAGTNSYATPDAANIGLSSGLDTRRSDYVGSFTLAPTPIFALMAKGRFDVDTFAPRRIDVGFNTNLGAFTGTASFADYQAQPLLGYYVHRQGLALSSRYDMTDHVYFSGNVTFDMGRRFYPASIIGYDTSAFPIANMGIGAGYHDECCTFTVNYSSGYYDRGTGTLSHTDMIMVELQLRTLGDFKFNESVAKLPGLDGL